MGSVEEVCSNRGTSGHKSEIRDNNNKLTWKCREPTKCCHCKGNHSSGHKECPRYIKEKKICEEMAVNKLSKMEAKAKVNQTKEQQIDSLKGIIEEILERKLSVLNSDEMLRKINSMEEERIKDKET